MQAPAPRVDSVLKPIEDLIRWAGYSVALVLPPSGIATGMKVSFHTPKINRLSDRVRHEGADRFVFSEHGLELSAQLGLNADYRQG
ncbi:hypothetical protein QTH97_30355 [Variovorax sp. J22R24]|nr:hypothetical protein [Variovorax sp. J22R24]MDM0109274.1 hypothetical protein [Variovorax sp. J22R24]